MAKKPSVVPAERSDELVDDVLAGLKKPQKELSPVWFYDRLGSFLFESICELPEYYLTRTEIAIMREHAPEMAQHIGREAALIELGSGTSLKTRLLLEQIETPAAYVPVDIAREHLYDAAAALARDYPALRIIPACADFTQPFDLPAHIASAPRKVVYFPGSTIGNFEPDQAKKLLRSIREMIGSSGAVLIGVDLRKDPPALQRAYDDRAGVTAEFNLNALRHLNRELGTDFNLDAFEHAAVWVDDKSRIEMHLVSKRDQRVRVGEEEVKLARGEHIRTECSHKYTLESFSDLVANADLSVSRVWMDDGKQFSVQFLEPRSLQ